MSNLVQTYGWTTEQAAPSHGYITGFVLNWLKRSGARRVLDLGAGNGVLCSAMARAGFDVVGVEYDAAGVAIAKSANPAIPFYCFGVQDDPQALLSREAPFDAVVSTEVIEHLFSPHLLPQYARAVLKPGGRLLVTTPYHGYAKNLALSLAGKWDAHHGPNWHGGHIKFFSRATLSELLQANGFGVSEFRGIGRLPYLWKSMAVAGVRT
jgi:2-polyprenyl-3-methyl-5-hydroxy-6-metoxy-1,4-benzoquinol methylase